MTSSSYEYDSLFKVVIVGDAQVGKSNLMSQLTRRQFDPHHHGTVGVEFGTTTVEMPDGYVVKLQVWDGSVESQFRLITKAYFRGAAGIVMVYDVTRPETLWRVQSHWEKEVAELAPEGCVWILAGAKSDMLREKRVDVDSGSYVASRLGAIFFEVSAKDNVNVTEAFMSLTESIRKVKGM